MDQDLWNKIAAFNFDTSSGEYGFSARLAKENYWTESFTEHALSEYKKFMYLAATSGEMVSPSEIIDKVWHQHLVFSVSYQEFCTVLGKQIQHIPSTHTKNEFSRFRLARTRTEQLYRREFGERPGSIWNHRSIYESLNLKKARLKLRSFISLGILFFIVLTLPAYYLLKPLYIQVNNPDFIFDFTLFSILIIGGLELYNRYALKSMVASFDKDSFIFDLKPSELIYLQTQSMTEVVTGLVNELVGKGKVSVKEGTQLYVSGEGTETKMKQHILDAIHTGADDRPTLIEVVEKKPVFTNIINFTSAFTKYVSKSKKFGNIFYLNFTVLALLLLAAFTRIITGVMREKPVFFIVIATIGLLICILYFLSRLTKQLGTTIIPAFYKKELLSSHHGQDNSEWIYFLKGSAVLSAVLIPLFHTYKSNDSGSHTCSTCGSSCGSSCGGGCGGCGS